MIKIAIAGTSGKTTTIKILEHIFKTAGLSVLKTNSGLIGTFNTIPDVDVALIEFHLVNAFSKLLPEFSAYNFDEAEDFYDATTIKFDYIGITDVSLDVCDCLMFRLMMPRAWLVDQGMEYLTVSNRDYILWVQNKIHKYYARLVKQASQVSKIFMNGEVTTSEYDTLVTVDKQEKILTANFTIVDKGLLGWELNLDNNKIMFPLLGKHNVLNALLASRIAITAGVSLSIIKTSLESLPNMAGRAEIIHTPSVKNPFAIIRNFAETQHQCEDLITQIKAHASKLNVILSSRSHIIKRPVTDLGDGTSINEVGRKIQVTGEGVTDVFRKQFSKYIETIADNVVITKGNCFYENPVDIKDSLLAGFTVKPPVMADRKKALEAGINATKKGECLLILGDYVDISDQSYYELPEFHELDETYFAFDDKEVIERLLNE